MSNELSGILAELKRRGETPNVLANNFPAQENLINDPCTLKAAICERQSGKTYSAALYLVKEALETPRVNCVYIGKTRLNARAYMFKKVLPELNRKHNLGAKPNETNLEYTFPNSSVIVCIGADSSDAEMEKIRGNQYKLAVIDEAGAWKIDQRELVYDVLEPAMKKHGGTILMIGTPGRNLKSLFFAVTNGQEPGWSVHRWFCKDNPFMKDEAAAALQKILDKRPNFLKTETYKREYLAQWVFDAEERIYRFDPEAVDKKTGDLLNMVDGLPSRKEWYYALGIDLGYNDASAFVVVAYSPTDPNLYIIESIKQKKLIVRAVAEIIEGLKSKYQFIKMVCDPASKQVVEELKQFYHFPIERAEKVDKAGAISVMNSDFQTGNIKIIDSQATKPLRDEYESLVWDMSKDELVEASSFDNHATDAALYIFRAVKKYLRAYELEQEQAERGDTLDDFILRLEQQQKEQQEDPYAWLDE